MWSYDCDPKGQNNSFIGRNGSRRVAVDSLRNFLADSNVSSIIQIFGISGIGKSCVVKQAHVEAEKDSSQPRIVIIPTSHYIEFSIRTLVELLAAYGGDDMPPFEELTAIPEEILKYQLRWLKQNLKTEDKQDADILVIWWAIDHATARNVPYDLLGRLFTTLQSKSIKLVLELRGGPIDIDFDVRIGKPFAKDDIEILAFHPSEYHEYVQQRLHHNGSAAEVRDVLSTQIHHWTGTHPGLVGLVCKRINSAIDSGYSQVEVGHVSTFVEERIGASERLCVEQTSRVVRSLPSNARVAIAQRTLHGELERNGLVYQNGNDKYTVKMILKYGLETAQNPQTGGEHMALNELIGKYALTEAFKASHKTLLKLWNDVFPPTPLYVAALEEAVKEVQVVWSPYPEKQPRLNVREAMGQIQGIDVSLIQRDISESEIAQLLAEHVRNCDNRADFAQRVVRAADPKFKKALALDDRREAVLWKKYVVKAAEEQARGQDEILEKVLEVAKVLEAWLMTDNSTPPRVSTVEEMLGPIGYIENEKIENWPSTRLDLGKITKDDFSNNWTLLWTTWWTDRILFRGFVGTVENLRRLPPPLTMDDATSLADAQNKLNEHLAKMAQVKVDLLALSDQGQKLFLDAN